MINENELIKLIKGLCLDDKVLLSDIPDLKLYMDQVTNFIDEKLGNLKRHEDDKILTKTMINNYTKQGLLMPPKNKKYTKQHIILMILVYYLKQILTLDDIKELFNPILKDMTDTEDDVISLNDIYSIFLELKDNEIDDFEDSISRNIHSIKEKVDNLDSESQNLAQLFLIVIMLVAQANAQKRLAEKIIDTYFKNTDYGK
ncbi:DUF1836 domain-containing protein [Tepidibacter formicigenes]|jgi:DNA-binding transcriptional MerR regulator|uniref:DUF1836 domain-containing protein n=1 Tax=Tepidibacter formicigenes DSM 15518 TaxID=1123349 RepID=A0A1M6M3K8_9FIRM|nr:DUF1836 domain-containing protein [Tepidibacter formicigenes]SHJ77987.1 protein of unknown function [Tepidibacter formicigenes DSM 15518]